ncbi:Lar family restriction alleviation protein [Acetivibrio ethanolgignens]|uniref:Uncharacterized protein n=1 Tax=Acetivibrio ethanolgignens TaxID=290052 RepID=A0A0V8QEZ9_9FIRM|nr:Lar family restriction alleviation protein [Acetivibrio ethanolgignens]KSV59136.1 hypothetical protein ASU35_10275 [Acetivibrio ethanolgignens]
MAVKLRECPVCAGTVQTVSIDNTTASVVCKKCGTSVTIASSEDMSETLLELADAWNKREELDNDKEVLELIAGSLRVINLIMSVCAGDDLDKTELNNSEGAQCVVLPFNSVRELSCYVKQSNDAILKYIAERINSTVR